MKNQKFNVQLWLIHNRQKDNQSKLFICVVVDGKRVEIATTYFIKKSEWDHSKAILERSGEATIESLQKRIELWDGVYEQLTARKSIDSLQFITSDRL